MARTRRRRRRGFSGRRRLRSRRSGDRADERKTVARLLGVSRARWTQRRAHRRASSGVRAADARFRGRRKYSPKRIEDLRKSGATVIDTVLGPELDSIRRSNRQAVQSIQVRVQRVARGAGADRAGARSLDSIVRTATISSVRAGASRGRECGRTAAGFAAGMPSAPASSRRASRRGDGDDGQAATRRRRSIRRGATCRVSSATSTRRRATTARCSRRRRGCPRSRCRWATRGTARFRLACRSSAARSTSRG